MLLFSGTGCTSTSSYYNSATAAYYDNTPEQGNHAVTIVGWDDNFSAKNFSTTPSGNGAWLCKNSWGTSFGTSRVFLRFVLTTANMGHLENAVFTAEPTTNYATNYQYDPFGMENSIGSGSSSTAYGANVFTATSTGTLKAVSFWAPYANTQYTAQVYVNPTDSSNPTSGSLMSTISGTASASYTGYFTENLSTTVPLTQGQTFAVVIKFTAPQGDNNPVPVQYQSGDDSKAPNAVAGESFFSPDGTTWTDLATYGGSAANSYVANIHAFESGAITVAGAPAVTAQNANSVDLFVKGTDNALWYKHWDGTKWSNSTSLGGVLTSDPAATSSATAYHQRLCARHRQRHLVEDHHGWRRHVVQLGLHRRADSVRHRTRGLLMGLRSSRRLCARYGRRHAGQTAYMGTSWSNWQSLGGVLTSSPAATSRNSGGMTVFVRGNDGGIWSRDYVGGSWGNWVSIGGQTPAGRAPAVCSWGRSSRRLCTRYGWRPVAEIVYHHVWVVQLAIHRRLCDVVTRSDVTGSWSDRRAFPRQQQRPLGKDL